MKKFLLAALFLVSLKSSFGQINYLEKGNAKLNDGDFASAEHIFREAIKTDSANFIYQNQLALSLIKQNKHKEAQTILDKILSIDSVNIAALWYSGTNNFVDENSDLRTGIKYFEKSLTLLAKNQPQYYSANWFIGKSYRILLNTSGLSYDEVSRMIDCYAAYLKLQPNAEDAAEISAYIQHIKEIRPPANVKMWVNKRQ